MNFSMKHSTLRFAILLFVLTLCIPTVTYSQKSDKQKKKEEQRRKKEERRKKKAEKQTAKQIQRYAGTLVKAKNKYAEDIDFKDAVNSDYKRLRRDHAKLAFEINTYDSEDFVTTYSGDKVSTEDTLYDNFMAQDYVNRVGQSLVPRNSKKRYGFKVMLEPTPEARSLSTGTVYISTGLLSIVDNEAQLAYILSHEIAHIEKDHWQEDIMVAKWVEEATRKQEVKASIIGGIAGGLLGGIGGKSASDALIGAAFGSEITKYLFKLFDRKSFLWTLAQEDESDQLAMQYMLKRNYDVREVTTFYANLQNTAIDDPRVDISDFADSNRSSERMSTVSKAILEVPAANLQGSLIGAVNLQQKYYPNSDTGNKSDTSAGKALGLDRNFEAVLNSVKKTETAMSADIKDKLTKGLLIAGDGEFENIMATLKRDNGVVAFYYDMYSLAERNLSQSLLIRSDDPLAYFFYGKVLKLTARKPGEQRKALLMFTKAIEYDKRGAYPQSRLYQALTKMTGRSTNNVQGIAGELKQYVVLYQRMHGGELPPNMNIIYDYLQEAGDSKWSATPRLNVSEVESSSTQTSSIPATLTTSAPAKKTTTRRKSTRRRKP